MKLLIIHVLILVAWLAGSASAAELRSIELNDGSVIFGEIVDLANDVFTIKSEVLGTIKIKVSDIKNIQMKPGSVESGDSLQEIQRSVMSDPDLLEMILSLQDDPEIRTILQDPDLMASLNSGDINTLLSDPRIIKLLNHPKVKAVIENALKRR